MSMPVTVAAEIDRIDLSPAELATMMQEATMNLLLVDTRDRVAFAAASIAGAYHVDDPQRPALDAPGFDAIVLIGDHTRPAQIGLPGALYAEHGSSQLFRLTDGPPQWRAANLPVVPGGGRRGALPRVPFVVPRGLCERAEPALRFDREP